MLLALAILIQIFNYIKFHNFIENNLIFMNVQLRKYVLKI